MCVTRSPTKDAIVTDKSASDFVVFFCANRDPKSAVNL